MPDDKDYFQRNSGEGKRFPGGPTCHYLGKDVPCFCAWSEKGGVTREILRDMIATLDKLEIFSRKNCLPFLICDAHGSRFEFPFLEYISNPDHEWAVCIGVPYGTALWQVGDSEEQNGSMNMASVTEKRAIIDEKERMMVTPVIEPYKITRIVRSAWVKSFARVECNKKAIAERGWLPFNRNLLTYPCLRASMTTKEKETEMLETSDVKISWRNINKITDLAKNPTYETKYSAPKYLPEQVDLNMACSRVRWTKNRNFKSNFPVALN